MSHITVLNNTPEVVRIAIFKHAVVNPTLATTAWRVAEPPPGGQATVTVPPSYTIYGKYSTDAANPSRLDAETADESFAETTAAFSIEAVSSRDQNAPNVVIRRYFDDLVMNEVRIFNNYGLGVLTAIAMDRYPIFTPQVIWPGGLFIEDLRGPLYAALVSQPTNPGQRLIQEEISLTQVELLESSTLIVSGSIWTGYALEVE